MGILHIGAVPPEDRRGHQIHGAGAPGSCESPDVGVGDKFWSFSRAIQTLNRQAICLSLKQHTYVIHT